jgi:hypothetical protein
MEACKHCRAEEGGPIAADQIQEKEISKDGVDPVRDEIHPVKADNLIGFARVLSAAENRPIDQVAVETIGR